MKLFTLQEALAILPELRRRMDIIQSERKVLRRLEPETRAASERARENGGTPVGTRYVEALQIITEQVQAILNLGIQIKDFEHGLCDFPHERDGRIVFLCWKYGEDSIEWWHDLDSGFAGRQPL